MPPVHEFKANFSQAEGVTDTQPDSVADALTLHEDDSSVRNLCLVWEDGRRAFLNYAYLIAGEFEPNEDKNTIKLSFSSHSVMLQGYRLESLFAALLDHLPRSINAIDSRYALTNDDQAPAVITISLKVI